MAVAVVTSGTTATLVINAAETSLTTITAPGVYQFVIDLTPMLAIDELEIRIYSKPTTISDPERQMYFHGLWNQQDNALKATVPIISPISFRPTLKMTGGTGRAFTWAVWKL